MQKVSDIVEVCFSLYVSIVVASLVQNTDHIKISHLSTNNRPSLTKTEQNRHSEQRDAVSQSAFCIFIAEMDTDTQDKDIYKIRYVLTDPQRGH